MALRQAQLRGQYPQQWSEHKDRGGIVGTQRIETYREIHTRCRCAQTGRNQQPFST